MKRLLTILRELNNYFYIGRMISKHKDTEDWKKLNLRVAWFNTIYAVINLPAEVYESTEDIHKLYLIDQVSIISDYFTKLNFLEIVQVTMEKIDRVPNQAENQVVHAYLVTFPPMFKEFTLWWLIKWSTLVSVCTWIQLAYNPVGAVIKLVGTLIGKLHNINTHYL
jgi:hypothetical protein